MIASIRPWVSARLSRQLYVALGATLTVLSIAFLVLFLGYYRGRLVDERARTSAEINDLLQVSLENAMLKRDIEGLQEIVARLGTRKSVKGVMILNTKGEVRFASDRSKLGQRFDITAGDFCARCDLTKGGNRGTTFVRDGNTGGILRSVNAVANREPCQQCHGDIASHPVNGILVVDYDAGEIKHEAMTMGLAMTGAGILVLLGGRRQSVWFCSARFCGPFALFRKPARTLPKVALIPTSISAAMTSWLNWAMRSPLPAGRSNRSKRSWRRVRNFFRR